MRGQPSTTAVDLITLMLIGAISAAVMTASAGGLQWLAGAVALATPVLAHRVLRHGPSAAADGRRRTAALCATTLQHRSFGAPAAAPVMVHIERHGRARGRVA